MSSSNRIAGEYRRRIALGLAVLCLGLSVAAAHTGSFGMDHMAEPAAMCLAIVGAALVIGAGSGVRARPSQLSWERAGVSELPASASLPLLAAPARAGPPALQVFLL